MVPRSSSQVSRMPAFSSLIVAGFVASTLGFVALVLL
jgi:hypothetical protein